MMWQHLLAQIWVIFYENGFGGTPKICSSENQQEFDERHGLLMKDKPVCSACRTGYNNHCICRLSVRQGLWVGHRLGKPEGGSISYNGKWASRGGRRFGRVSSLKLKSDLPGANSVAELLGGDASEARGSMIS